MATDKTDKRQTKHWQFKAGQSGNPTGRPKGSRNQATLAAQALLEGEIEAISRKVVELAKEGDMQAIKLVLERVVPPCRDKAISMSLPKLQKSEDALKALSEVVQQVVESNITLEEGQKLLGLIEGYQRMHKTTELEQRLTKLEENHARKSY